ncbi:MAG: NfeD family protein [Bacteroidota bacterium]
MAEWFTVIALLLVGIGLIIVEIIFVPGTTFVGIIGLLVSAYAVYIGFDYFGTNTGYAILGGTLFLNTLAVVYALRSGAWERFSLKTSSNSRVNEGLQDNLKVGDEGQTISALRPMGKAEFNDKVFEVTTGSSFLDSGKRIKIVLVKNNRITVEPID